MAKKSKATLEGETYAKSHTKGTGKTVKETAVEEQTAEEGWTKDDISSEDFAPVSAPVAKIKDPVLKSHTQDVKIIVEGREFLDIDDNMITCGETGTFTTEYAEMLKKLKVAE